MKRMTFMLAVCLWAGCGESVDSGGGVAGAGGTGGSGGTSGEGGEGGAGGVAFSVWPCTEEGVRDAITFGGGPHTFACDGPTVVVTDAPIEIYNDVILDGEGRLTLDGNEDHRVFVVGGNRPAVVALHNMTITRGYAEVHGGGIFNSRSDLLLEGCSIVDNVSGWAAGGIYSYDGVLRIVDSTISRNEAQYGGGILCGGDELSIVQTTIADNLGGGIDNSGVLTVVGSTITGNVHAFGGGGIFNWGDLLVSASIVSGNEGSVGGGIFNAGALSMFETTVEGNTAEEGGGIFASDAVRYGGDLSLAELGLANVAYSTISNNSAERGAGIYSIALRTTIWNSTISGNVASEEGGAVYVGATTLGASTTHLTQNTIADNSAPVGDAVLASGDEQTLRFAGNLVSGGCQSQDGAVFDSRGYNVESPGQSCGFVEPSDVPNATSEELGLGPLQNNGRETETHLPRADSIAIDLIPAEECANVLPVRPAFDQRVIERPKGAGCDAGSVEVVP
ncbi:MAG: choice-of-anchor Q domain-containing protein [Polyangiales bacterium]